ncbi:unnamed protein product [Mytilus coruscus]|uniref:CCHC-type domain-containing protein n=1 Tax=Mytilus coruscus TaxID=42192 RepID=A0A6J8EX73_MYTCO|nr:unnamed protein product [Mytilus coruscus]
MSNSDPDLDVRDQSESCGANTELSTDGALSLFSVVPSNALEQQKNNIIKHFESRFANKSEKATGVDATDFSFKHEGNRIQHSFNIERSDKLSKIDSYIKFNSLDAASRLIVEEKETLRKRNKILKIADKHGWDTVQEYLDSPLTDNKDDAINLRSAIARANSRRTNSKPYDRPVEKSTNGNGRPDKNRTKFNTKEFFRGFCQFNVNDGNRGKPSSNFQLAVCFYCNQPGHVASVCPFKESHLQLSAHQKNRFQNQHEVNSSQSSVINESQWKQFEGYANNPRLASVIDVLPSFIESSKANSTNNKYRIYFEKFRKWCVSFGLQYFPATSTTISLYIGGLIQQGISVSVLDSNYYLIKWHHDKNFKYNPCSDEFLSLILEGGKSILSNKKEPVTPEILQMIISKYGIDNDLSSLRICVLCFLCFSCFLRYSELAAIKAENINIFDSHMSILLEKSKTDIYRRGSSVIISKTGGNLCPVKWLLKYLQLANIEVDSDQYIFRALCYLKTRGIHKLCSKNSQLLYTMAREILLEAFESVGLDKSKFGLHSLRSGGASTAANFCISERFLKAHGRWASDRSKDVVWGITDLPIIFGENVTLFCNTTSIQENRVTWMKESDVIVHHGLVFYRSKFAEYSVSEGSSLTIINTNENDFGVSYTCIADIFSFDSMLELNVSNYIVLPSRNDTYISWSSSSRTNPTIYFARIFPIPNCQILHNADIIPQLPMSKSHRNGYFYNVTVNFGNPSEVEKCDGYIEIECNLTNRKIQVGKRNVLPICNDVIEKNSITQGSLFKLLTVSAIAFILMCVLIGTIAWGIRKHKTRTTDQGTHQMQVNG